MVMRGTWTIAFEALEAVESPTVAGLDTSASRTWRADVPRPDHAGGNRDCEPAKGHASQLLLPLRAASDQVASYPAATR